MPTPEKLSVLRVFKTEFSTNCSLHLPCRQQNPSNITPYSQHQCNLPLEINAITGMLINFPILQRYSSLRIFFLFGRELPYRLKIPHYRPLASAFPPPPYEEKNICLPLVKTHLLHSFHFNFDFFLWQLHHTAVK